MQPIKRILWTVLAMQRTVTTRCESRPVSGYLAAGPSVGSS